MSASERSTGLIGLTWHALRSALLFLFLIISFFGCNWSGKKNAEKIVLISANAEWNAVKKFYPGATLQPSPFGEYFSVEVGARTKKESIIFFHGGWGKVTAAASAQYCIDRWAPRYMINLGTCGGLEGSVKKFDIVLANKTVIYDITEAMGDPREAINDYTTVIDLSWLKEPYPAPVIKTLLVSADRDLVPSEIPGLQKQYQAIAGDWESGAIAYTCAKNHQRLLILRGVTDLVGVQSGGEAYQNEPVFVQGTEVVMKKLLSDLPLWLEKCK